MNRWGRFIGNVEVEWVDSPSEQYRITDRGMRRERARVMRLLVPFAFQDAKTGMLWEAPAGTYIDGASVPRLFWRIFDPYVGAYRDASVVHDRACQEKTRPSHQVHAMFYRASRAAGTGPLVAFAMWLAVRLFGPRFPGKEC